MELGRTGHGSDSVEREANGRSRVGWVFEVGRRRMRRFRRAGWDGKSSANRLAIATQSTSIGARLTASGSTAVRSTEAVWKCGFRGVIQPRTRAREGSMRFRSSQRAIDSRGWLKQFIPSSGGRDLGRLRVRIRIFRITRYNELENRTGTAIDADGERHRDQQKKVGEESYEFGNGHRAGYLRPEVQFSVGPVHRLSTPILGQCRGHLRH